nr:hypothetical protein [Tanacetum cinerariifolium]
MDALEAEALELRRASLALTLLYLALKYLVGLSSDIYVSKEPISVVNNRFNDTVYGFFWGKHVAYHVVENYVKNTSTKFGLVKSITIKDMFFFKFGYKEGTKAMLDSCPWLIRNVPLILKQWTPDANMMKEDVSNIPVWESFIMFILLPLQKIGRASYARAMVELKAVVKLRDTIVVVVAKFNGEGFILSIICVEYVWAPPRCLGCKVFGHILDECRKKITSCISKNSKMSRQPGCGPPVQMTNKDTTPNLNSFDALSNLMDEEEGGGNQTLSTNAIPIVVRINDLERHMLDGKLVVVDDHGKPLEMELTNKASASKPTLELMLLKTSRKYAKGLLLLVEDLMLLVILNGDSPIPTRVVDGVVQPIALTTTEHGLDKKNELKARGTLLMALLVKHQLKFNIYKDAKSLMEAIEKRFGGNKETNKRNKADLEDQSLDDLFNNLKIYELEVKSLSSTSHNTQNIAFVSSQNTDITNESVSVIASVSAASTKPSASILPNVDNLSDVVIYFFFASQPNSPQLENDDLKQIDADDLEDMDLKSPKDARNKDTQRRNVLVKTSTSNALVSHCDGVGSYDWSFQADEEPTNYALMAFTSSSSTSSLGSDSEVALCSKACLESVKARLVVYQQNENVFEEDIKLLKLDVKLRDNALVELRKKFEAAKKERDELKHTLEKNLDFFKKSNYESDVSVPPSPVHDRYKSGEGYHAVPPPYTGTFMPSKSDLVFHDAFTGVKGNWVWKLKCPVLDHVFKLTKINGEYVAFGGNPKGGKITGKGKIKTCKLDFDDVYFVKELKFNLFSVSQMCDKKNNVLFTDIKCVVLSPDFKLHDQNHMLLRVPR